MVYDFAQLETQESVAELEKKLNEALQGKSTSILVNNVGVMHVGSLEVASIETVRQAINVNINAQTFMSQYMLPRLLVRSKMQGTKTRSAIISLSSKAAEMSTGYRPIYGSTKRYNLTLSQALNDYAEMHQSENLDILSVIPASTTTIMNPNTKRIFTVRPQEHTKAVINHLARGYRQTRGSYWHAMQNWLEHNTILSPLAKPYL